jgi:geranylgeranyl pyrophosphate synthase
VYATSPSPSGKPAILSFSDRIDHYLGRVTRKLNAVLPGAGEPPERLHDAMRYAVFNGGKRIRPLLVYATGECLGIDEARLDAPAAAIELVHAFSLVHDDLPAMDDDDLRRGQPTVHRRYDEATAILAADALQPLAFAVLSGMDDVPAATRVRLVRLLADACGSVGMTGGQAIDLASEGKMLSGEELERMYGLKTGALIHAAVASACLLRLDLPEEHSRALGNFAHAVGIAFQIRDDVLDIEGETTVIGKPAGSDAGLRKATYPGQFGLEPARRRCDALLVRALAELDPLKANADALRWLARYIVERVH